MDSPDDFEHLAWFLGPKAEQAPLLEQLVLEVLRDHIYWRRNYYPADPSIDDASSGKRFEAQHDALRHRLLGLLAELRRNFPFHSPRYLAHQLSDPSLPAIIGAVAGLLYNSNNVTPEAAPVTVEWEIEACSELLRMLGYIPPPDLPASAAEMPAYVDAIGQEFGWCHTTPGGTTANLEALWVARVVRYFPLAVRDIAIRERLEVQIQRPDGSATLISELAERDVLRIAPEASIALLPRFVEAVRRRHGVAIETASETAWALLNTSDFAPANSLGRVFDRFPPALFVSGAAHYSIRKAADILGIGRNSIVLVDTDDRFRIDVTDLRLKLFASVDEGRIPVAVIGIAGTTEEGAVDPVHRIVELRDELAERAGLSVWLHVDAAWGGYLRSLFRGTTSLKGPAAAPGSGHVT